MVRTNDHGPERGYSVTTTLNEGLSPVVLFGFLCCAVFLSLSQSARADMAWMEARMANPKLACDDSERFALIVHAGAYWGMDDDPSRTRLLREIAQSAGGWLRRGAPALSVVEEAVVLMEDAGIFNAGRGAIVNREGFVELDAAIMDGRDLNVGAVAGVRRMKNPIRGAKLVMSWTPHVLLSGTSADDTLAALGAETVDPDYFPSVTPKADFEQKGTVGAVALDRCGDLAAAGSTGGFEDKMAGRIGDTPVPGAGLYAENGLVAVASTGHGESFLKTALAHEVAARMRWGGQSVEEAARGAVLETLGGIAGEGGLIALDANGNTITVFNSTGLLSEAATWRDAAGE
ncbi:isoaspartyl peptidase/L-asparaginase family protein [Roseobacter sp. MH60115]|uniref:isoaspartyl peptidase/L-asparaginase family protein n=1 Tax=Roseobacter sp. MH60115 TaxID=2785324 RepID=UPI0018A26B86|nr:isoaspartyl peptidase/L-asparaginase [Roseobacter sp. MH60115]